MSSLLKYISASASASASVAIGAGVIVPQEAASPSGAPAATAAAASNVPSAPKIQGYVMPEASIQDAYEARR